LAVFSNLSDVVIRNIEIARECFPYVTVEIPSIKQDFPILLLSLERLARISIDFLNLHDYILTEKDPNGNLELSETFTLNETLTVILAKSSQQNTTDIISYSLSNGYPFHINRCSIEQKEMQMLQRRLRTGKIFSDQNYDFFSESGFLYNFYSLPEQLSIKDLYEIFSDPEKSFTFKNYMITKYNFKSLIKPDNILLSVSFIPKIESNQNKILRVIKYITADDPEMIDFMNS